MKISKKIAYALPALLMLGLGSCKSYLDKSPDSDVSEEEAFGNFRNFQGFVEEAYINVPIWTTSNWNISWNYGEDEILSTNGNSPYVTYNFDLGDYRAYYNNWGGGFTHMYGPNTDHQSTDRFAHHILNDAWYMIRKCNIGIDNLPKLTQATDDQKKAIEGQLYFWRAWFHAEMLYYMGGLPYMNYVADAELRDKRLSVQETALKCAEDFGHAAELLPVDWDKSDAGEATEGHNELRITKDEALAYQGKLLLWAASPLAVHGAQTGALANGLTYKYDADIAAQAAKVLGDCIALIESGATPHELASYDFEDIYEHTPAAGVDNIYSEIFWTMNKNWMQPGGKEAMLRGNRGGINGARWGEATNWGPNVKSLCDGGFCIAPTANYVDYAYGMANGEPAFIYQDGELVPNKEAGFDPEHPFKGRDPRFYHDIIYDGCRFINGDAGETFKEFIFCTLHTGGIMRDAAQGSRSGYLCQKFFPHVCNHVDDGYGYGKAGQSYMPFMRVADVYLMYAEAGAAVQGASYKAGATAKTAEEAINVLRKRVGAGNVSAKYTADQKLFMDEVRRERACELAFEGRRMPDLMRWLLITEKPYTIKQSCEFTRVDADYNYEEKDPADAAVAGYSHKTILERNYSSKHYFWPWMDKHVYIYEDFPQNPGW